MLELFWVFFKLGLLTIGGGIAMIPILRRVMVEDKKWFNDDEMLNIITVCQGMPGVIAVNMATYVGFKRRGFLGSLVATFGVVIPSFVIIILIAMGMNVLNDNAYVQGALGGLKAAAVGMIIVAAWEIGKMAIKDKFAVAGMLGSFVLIVFLKVNIILIIIAFLALGVLRTYIRIRRGGGDGKI